MWAEGRTSGVAPEGDLYKCFWLRNGRFFRLEDHLTETLRLLSEMAKNGSVTATVALARELRLDPGEEGDDELDAELDRLLEQGD